MSVKVVVKNNFDAALRKFKKKVEKAGVLKLYLDKQQYIKPSARKRKTKNKK